MGSGAPNRRLQATQFRPGQSGNPGGRPKGTTLAGLRVMCRSNVEAAIERLTQLIQSRDESIAMQAIQFAFLYGFGKPMEGRDVAHMESMRAKHQELEVTPEPQAQLPAPTPGPEPVAVTPEVEAPSLPPEPPPEAPESLLPPLGAPSGLRCLYRGREGQCAELAAPGIQWCQPHRTKLFATLEAT